MGFNILDMFGGPKLSFAGATAGSTADSNDSGLRNMVNNRLMKIGFDDHCPSCGGPVDHCPTCGGATHMNGYMGPGRFGPGGPMGRMYGPRRRRGSRGIIIAIIVAVVILAVVGITLGVVLTKNNKEEEVKYGKVCYFLLDSSEELISFTDKYEEVDVEAGAYYHLPILKADGYTFCGYCTPDGVQYVNEHGVSNTVAAASDNLVLYPTFKANSYVIEFDVNGGSGISYTELPVTYGETLAPFAHNLTKEGYNFDGWYTTPSGDGICVANKNGVIAGSSKFTFTNFGAIPASSNVVTLYARYSVKTFTVTFQFADSSASEVKVVEYGSNVNKAIQMEEYSLTESKCTAFAGWSLKKDGSEKVTTVTSDVTLYEVRTPVVYIPALNIISVGGGTYDAPASNTQWYDVISKRSFDPGDPITVPTVGVFLIPSSK